MVTLILCWLQLVHSTLGIPDSAGVPKSIAQEVITVPFNDIEPFKEALEKWGDQIAAVLVEPIVGNFGIVEPNPGFLQQVNDLTHAAGALVIYDEVITAFRFMYGGAQDLLGVQPDLTVLGKNHWRRFTNWCLWRKKRNYGKSCTTRTCLSSWNDGWKSCFDAFRNCLS